MNNSEMEYAVNLLKRHEGFSESVYICTAGARTIGFGYNIDEDVLKLSIAGDYKMSEQEAEDVLREYVRKFCIADLQRIFGAAEFNALNKYKKGALISMLYNLGTPRFLRFENFMKAVTRRNYELAAIEMVDSLWFKQVKYRAIELVKLIQL